MKKVFKKVIIVLSLLFIILGMAFFAYTGNYYHAEEEVYDYLSLDNVEIRDEVIIFNNDEASKNIIFYPGAKVEYLAYVPLMSKLSENGFECYLLKMPFNLAFFGVNKAYEFLDENKQNYLMGHSLGASMACEFVKNNTASVDGLILLAGYSASNISDYDISTISIYGTEDGVLNLDKYNDSKINLPSNFKEYIIEGGNHAGFGFYGKQKNDKPALISSKEQIDITVNEIKKLLK